MKTQEIITSGILELYVLGQASPAETELVRANLHNEEIKKELEEIELALMDVAFAVRKQVPSKVKDNLDKLLFAENNQVEARIIPLEPLSQKTPWWAIAAAVLCVLSISGNLFQYKAVQKLSAQLSSFEVEKSMLAADYQVLKANNQIVTKVTDFFKSEHIKSVELQSVNDKQNYALAYFCSQTGNVAINTKSLAAITNEYQYQLWALVDGKPVDLGVIPNELVGKDQITLLKNIKGMQAFAITKEEYGGKPTPNLDELVVMGKV